ncbi:MAG: hypothetical protein A2Z18_01465 [Armatimonadetes bacterium RBG_16_58_9]|nr:MAG: hypothetical protein A2Z18_01465 [Armatimonadetes bacterium RBG_16_58_9]
MTVSEGLAIWSLSCASFVVRAREAQMLEAAERLCPKLLMPYHWDVWHGLTGDALELGRLAERRKPPFDVQLLLIGQYLHYVPGGRLAGGHGA